MAELKIVQSKDAKNLSQSMAEDGHFVPNATHAAIRDGVTVGAFSVEYAPALFFWMHTKLATARDSLIVFKAAMRTIRESGHDKPLVMVQNSSPFYSLMKKRGLELLGSGEVWISI